MKGLRTNLLLKAKPILKVDEAEMPELGNATRAGKHGPEIKL